MRTLAGLAGALRGAGMVVGSGQVITVCDAVAHLEPGDPDDVYWAGRACLVSRHEDVATYDRVFRSYFGGPAGAVAGVVSGHLPRLSIAPALAPPPAADDGRHREAPSGAMASNAEVLRHKRFEDCTDAELEALRTMMAQLRLTTPMRRTRRTLPSSAGRLPDLRRTIRRSLRTQGEWLDPAWRVRRVRPRRVVLVLDVSGSMAGYSRALLQFSHTAVSAARPQSEVFCFGTRLTRVTTELRERRPDQALSKAAEAVVDWEGGTRIGPSIGELVRTWGRRAARGAVVVICSDGLERGDPEVLTAELTRLARLAYRIVWVNPLKADARYQPLARGMRTAMPFVDIFHSGHDLSSLEELADLLADLR